MSVPKSRRGESPAEYINLAREIYVFTYNRVRILPKSYTFYFSLPLYNAARERCKSWCLHNSWRWMHQL